MTPRRSPSGPWAARSTGGATAAPSSGTPSPRLSLRGALRNSPVQRRDADPGTPSSWSPSGRSRRRALSRETTGRPGPPIQPTTRPSCGTRAAAGRPSRCPARARDPPRRRAKGRTMSAMTHGPWSFSCRRRRFPPPRRCRRRRPPRRCRRRRPPRPSRRLRLPLGPLPPCPRRPRLQRPRLQRRAPHHPHRPRRRRRRGRSAPCRPFRDARSRWGCGVARARRRLRPPARRRRARLLRRHLPLQSPS